MTSLQSKSLFFFQWIRGQLNLDLSGPGFEPEADGYPFGFDAHYVIHWGPLLGHDRGSY